MNFSIYRRKLLWTSATVAAVALSIHACGHHRVPFHMISDEETLAYRQCTQDDECTYVANGCCDCGGGMTKLSINKNKLTAFEQEKKRRCSKGYACPDAGWGIDCELGGNVCIEGICTYIEPGRDSEKHQVYWEYPKGVRHYPEEERKAETKPADTDTDTGTAPDSDTDTNRINQTP